MNTYILDFGAKPDVKTLCTKEIQTAIDTCAASGGGRVTVPAGIYISGTIWLRSNVELHFEDGAMILQSDDPSDFVNPLKGFVEQELVMGQYVDSNIQWMRRRFTIFL